MIFQEHAPRTLRTLRSNVMTTLRQQLEAREREVLAPLAARSADSRGRLRPEREDDVRPAFQRDRDRIIHCKAFRRLKHKTQVFFAPTGDLLGILPKPTPAQPMVSAGFRGPGLSYLYVANGDKIFRRKTTAHGAGSYPEK